MNKYQSIIELLNKKLLLFREILICSESVNQVNSEDDAEIFYEKMRNIDIIIENINDIDNLIENRLIYFEDRILLLKAIKNECDRVDVNEDMLEVFYLSQKILTSVNKIQSIYADLYLKFNDVKQKLLNNIKNINKSNAASKYLDYIKNDEDIILNFKYDKI